jgi:microcystin-dependent protein
MGLFSGGTEIINGGELLEGGIPTATIVPWSSASVPSGFLECDGTAVSRTTYAALFAIVGTTYGAGDGSTTFGLPDLANLI